MANLKNLDKVIEDIELELDEKDAVREMAIKSARSIIRLTGNAMRRMHQGENPASLLKKAKTEAFKLRKMLEDHPELSYAGYVESALQEIAEAHIVIAIREGRHLPSPDSIGVTKTAYLLGLGDAVGELRRLALTELTSGEPKKASEYLRIMEDIFAFLMRFDYPHAIVAIKRKQDVARGLIEKTRGEIVVSSRGRELEKKLDELKKKLKI